MIATGRVLRTAAYESSIAVTACLGRTRVRPGERRPDVRCRQLSSQPPTSHPSQCQPVHGDHRPRHKLSGRKITKNVTAAWPYTAVAAPTPGPQRTAPTLRTCGLRTRTSHVRVPPVPVGAWLENQYGARLSAHRDLRRLVRIDRQRRARAVGRQAAQLPCQTQSGDDLRGK